MDEFDKAEAHAALVALIARCLLREEMIEAAGRATVEEEEHGRSR